MISSQYLLSHWDAQTPIYISNKCSRNLKKYHLMGIHFLYNCYHKQQKGAILNQDESMNFEIQVSSLLSALSSTITSQNPVLIICTQETICTWSYNLENYGEFNVTLLSVSNADDILEDYSNHLVILSSVENTIALKKIKTKVFFCVVVDYFDKLVSKSIVKQMKGQFNIGLTNRNFKKYPDQKLMWSMLNWANPGIFGKLADFVVADTEHLRNLRDPYNDWWQRLTWKYDDEFKFPTKDEIKEYQDTIREWSLNQDMFSSFVTKSETGKKSRKRKHLNQASTTTKKSSLKENRKGVSSQSVVEVENQQQQLTQNYIKIEQEDFHKSASSNDTIIYEFKNSPVDVSDENCILSSLINSKNLNTSACNYINEPESSHKEDEDSNSIVANIVASECSISRKKDLLSLLYGNE